MYDSGPGMSLDGFGMADSGHEIAAAGLGMTDGATWGVMIDL